MPPSGLVSFRVIGENFIPSRCRECAPHGDLKAHDVVSAIDVDDFAGDAAAGVGGEENSGAADFGNFDVAAQRSALGVGLMHVAEAGDAASRKGFDWSGGNGVDPNLLFSEFVC